MGDDFMIEDDWTIEDVNAYIGQLLEQDEKMMVERHIMSDNIIIHLKKSRMHNGNLVFFTAFHVVSNEQLQTFSTPKILLMNAVKHIRHTLMEMITNFVAENGPLQSVPLYANGGSIGQIPQNDMILMHGGYSSPDDYHSKVNKMHTQKFTITESPVREQDIFAQAARNMPGMNLIVENCPGCTPPHIADYGTCGTGHTLMATIMNLNDTHKWSREKIAEWIENHFDEVPYFEGAEDDAIANNA